MSDDEEEYEAKLLGRTPEEWAAMAEKAEADEKDVHALRSLMERRDAKELEHLAELAKPGMSISDRDYVLRQMGEIADRLRFARDNPDEQERRRGRDVLFAAAMVGSSKEGVTKMWLEHARDCFPAVRSDDPGEDAPMLEQARHAVESLLDALLMAPEDRAAMEKRMNSAFLQWAGENGVRAGRYNANGEFELLGEIVPFRPGFVEEAHFEPLGESK